MKSNEHKLAVAKLAVGYVIGAAIGLKVRRGMYNAGMIKSFWLPCMIRKPGTYSNEVSR